MRLHPGTAVFGFFSLWAYVVFLAFAESFRWLPAYFAGAAAVAVLWVLSVRLALKHLGKFEAEWLQAAGIAGSTLVTSVLTYFAAGYATGTLKTRGWRPLFNPTEMLLHWMIPAFALMFFVIAADQIRRRLAMSFSKAIGLALIGTVTGMICTALVIRIGRRIIEGR